MSVTRNGRIIRSCCGFVIVAACLCLGAPESDTLVLPAPQLTGGRPLMQVLKDRKSIRSFSAQKVSMQVLANLLWAAFGINRPETNGRTAPSAMNMQEIDVYVTLAKGLYRYHAKANALVRIHRNDIRGVTGWDPFVKEAALNIVLVADFSRMSGDDRLAKHSWAGMDAAYISQNIYLYCASEGLATIVRASIDRPKLAEAMRLDKDHEIMLAHDVGYPK